MRRALIIAATLLTTIALRAADDAGARWWAHVEALANDGMEGRNTGSAGHKRAADYVAAQFKKSGLEPAGAAGGYIQPVAFKTRRIIEASKSDIKALIGNTAVLRGLSPKAFVDGAFGLPTVTDILRELEKPGRDPRPAFKAAVFKEGVETLDDLKPGMVLEGAVTNVAAFGAFVDIGVHQDGLVHISAMSKTFVKDPRAVVKPGDIVRVKVLEVDKPRKRIALTLRLDDEWVSGMHRMDRAVVSVLTAPLRRLAS